MTPVAEARPVAAAREWFVDQRGVVRRMQVSWHPGERIVVFSLWQGDSCTGTFRLPIEEAGRVVALLGGSLAEAASGPGVEVPPGSWLARLRTRLERREPATVVHFDAERRRRHR
jgi:hypothetical protein